MRPVYERDSDKKECMFQPVMYRSQVVAGIHYYIKVGGRAGWGVAALTALLHLLQVMVEDGEIPKCVHLKVLRELDPQKVVFSLSAFREDKALDSPIEFF